MLEAITMEDPTDEELGFPEEARPPGSAGGADESGGPSAGAEEGSARRRSRFRTFAATLAPLVAVATLMLGLRVGASDAVRAAVLFGAPPPEPAPDGRTRLAWQLLTLVDDRGVRETVAMHGLSVSARTPDGREAAWSGDSNEDGIAEVTLAWDRLDPGTPLDVTVRAPGDPKPLAEGRVRWEETLPRTDRATKPVRPTKQTGSVRLDVLVEGERLVTAFDGTAWIRMTLPEGIAPTSLVLELEPEPGLELATERPAICKGTGRTRWAPVKMRAMGHITGVGIKAILDGATAGEWFGALPVAAGAFHPVLPRAVPAGEKQEIRIVAPNPRTVVYAEVDDARGRAAASALEVKGAPDEAPSAVFEVPPLARGLHWLLVSGEPRGGETLGGAAMGWPFLVGERPDVDTKDPCSIGPWLLQHGATPLARWTALDGLPARHANNRKRHAAGLAIALVALATAVVLEVLLLTAAAREAREAMAAVTAASAEQTGEAMTKRSPGGSLAVALLLVVLGFALLAVLVLAKS